MRCLEAEERNVGQEMLLMVSSQEMLYTISYFPCSFFSKFCIAHLNFLWESSFVVGQLKRKEVTGHLSILQRNG